MPSKRQLVKVLMGDLWLLHCLYSVGNTWELGGW